ncbi:Rad2 nuclease [Mucor circinelloides]
MDFMGLFKNYNVTPIVVFDGRHLPLKQGTNDERRSSRPEALKEDSTFYLYGDHAKARESFKKSVAITDDMIIDVLIAKPKDNPQNNNGNSPVMNALDIRSSESSPSMPKVLTQSDRLETFYRKLHIFPRKSRKATVDSATPSMTAISENANSTPQSFSYDDRCALPTTSAIPSADLAQSYEEGLRIWKSYPEKHPIPHHDVLHSTVKQASQDTECTTTIHKPSSSLQLSASYYHESLKDQDDTQEFSLSAPSWPTARVVRSLFPPFNVLCNRSGFPMVVYICEYTINTYDRSTE